MLDPTDDDDGPGTAASSTRRRQCCTGPGGSGCPRDRRAVAAALSGHRDRSHRSRSLSTGLIGDRLPMDKGTRRRRGHRPRDGQGTHRGRGSGAGHHDHRPSQVALHHADNWTVGGMARAGMSRRHGHRARAHHRRRRCRGARPRLRAPRRSPARHRRARPTTVLLPGLGNQAKSRPAKNSAKPCWPWRNDLCAQLQLTRKVSPSASP